VIDSTSQCGKTFESFKKIPVCMTESQAADKSRNIAPVFKFCRNPFTMNVVKARIWSQVLHPL